MFYTEIYGSTWGGGEERIFKTLLNALAQTHRQVTFITRIFCTVEPADPEMLLSPVFETKLMVSATSKIDSS